LIQVDPLEQFWEELLSGEPERIYTAFVSLDAETKNEVVQHLRKMTTEEGWHPLQKQSAEIALDVISPGIMGEF